MADQHKIPTRYVMGPNVTENLFDAHVFYDERPTEVSVLVYQDIYEAETHRKRLIDCRNSKRGNYIARPLFVFRSNDDQNKGLLFVDRILQHSTKFIGDCLKILNGTCLGFSDIFKTKFQQISFGLHAIHSAGHRLGSFFKEVVFYDENGNVKLANLNYFAEEINHVTLKQDFYVLRDFINEAKNGRQCCEIDDYLKLLSSKWPCGGKWQCGGATASCKYARWLYYGPIYWSSQLKGRFLDSMNKILKCNSRVPGSLDKLMKCHFGSDWRHSIPRQSPLYATLNYGTQLNPMYKAPSGLVALGRNYNHHHELFNATFDDIETLFPNILSALYLELVRTEFKEWEIIWDSNDKSWKRIEDYLWKEPCMFSLYEID